MAAISGELRKKYPTPANINCIQHCSPCLSICLIHEMVLNKTGIHIKTHERNIYINEKTFRGFVIRNGRVCYRFGHVSACLYKHSNPTVVKARGACIGRCPRHLLPAPRSSSAQCARPRRLCHDTSRNACLETRGRSTLRLP